APVPGRPARGQRQGTAALRRHGLHRRQPHARPLGRPLELAAADRPLLVPDLREAVRAGHAGHDPRLRLLQPVLPHHRRALHQRRHHGVHAAHPGRPVRRLPEPAPDHPARRRRGAVPLGPLPGPGAGHEAPAAGDARDEERVLRHLRVPPARHRPAAEGDPGRQHPVRLGDGGCGARHRPDHRPLLRRHQALHRRRRDLRRGPQEDLRGERVPGVPAPEGAPRAPGRMSAPAQPPVAAARPHRVESPHGTREDPYYWLRDDTRSDPEVLAYLEAENAWTDAVLAPLKPLQERIYQEIIGRIRQDDMSVPWRRNGYWYYSRYETGANYPIHARRRGSMDAPEEVMLDVSALAAVHDFYQVGSWDVSPDNRLLAFTEDTVGRRQFVLRVKDLVTGEM